MNSNENQEHGTIPNVFKIQKMIPRRTLRWTFRSSNI